MKKPKMMIPSVEDGVEVFNRACEALDKACIANNFGPLHQGTQDGEIGKTTLNPLAGALLPQMFKFYVDKTRWSKV